MPIEINRDKKKEVKEEPGEIEIFRRGRRLISREGAAEKARVEIPEGDAGFYWGGIKLPSDAATQHFLYIGQTKSGKTVTMKHLMFQVLQSVGKGQDTRALVYDAKGDIVSFLYSLGLPEGSIKILNPFDERCVVWDIAKDVKSPAVAQTIATIIVPEQQGENRFFTDAARQLLAGVMESFILIEQEREKNEEKPLHWTLRDVCLALRDTNALEQILSRHDRTKALIEYLNRSNNEVLATLKSYIWNLEIIAAAWDTTTKEGREREKISLTEWRDDPKGAILVLGRDPEAQTAIKGLNRIIFERITQVILKGKEVTSKRTWFFLDEFSKIGELTGFDDLLTNGRSKGACVVLGFQNLEGVKKVYGELADEIISECSSKAILKCDGGVAKWASEFIGKADIEREEESRGSNISYDGEKKPSLSRESGRSIRFAEKDVVHYSELSKLPVTGKKNGITAYFVTSYLDGVWNHSYPWQVGDKETLDAVGWIAERRSAIEPDYEEREDTEYQFLKRWNSEDLSRLTIKESLPTRDETYKRKR